MMPKRIWLQDTGDHARQPAIELLCRVEPYDHDSVEYIRADAAPVRVRQLEWTSDEAEPDAIRADHYDIRHEYKLYQIYYWSVVLGDPHDTIDAAKAYAQWDYEQRILAAIAAHD
jgi:hypothetical protein